MLVLLALSACPSPRETPAARPGAASAPAPDAAPPDAATVPAADAAAAPSAARCPGGEPPRAVRLLLGEPTRLADGLTLTLTSFNHKRPMVGGPTKAMASVTISQGAKPEELTLSIHGVEGKAPGEDGLTPEERFDEVGWGAHAIRLTAFEYDKAIEVSICPAGMRK
jgi:hypothetical protein